MKIYTVVETEESFCEPFIMKTEGARSFKSLSFAENDMANRIIERAQRDCVFSRALWNDENHGEEFREFMLQNTCREDVDAYFHRYNCNKMEFPEDVKRVMCRFILDVVVGEKAYHIYSCRMDELTFHLDIVESELEV